MDYHVFLYFCSWIEITRSKTYLLDSFTITTTSKEQQLILGLPRIWAQTSHI